MHGTNMPGSGDASQRARLVGQGSRLSSLPLRGRERITELLGRKLAEVELGKSAAVVLRGIAGAGKTRLLAEVLDDAAHRHWRTAVAVADPDSSLIPLGPVIDAAASATPPLLRRAEIESLASNPDMRFWLVQALQDALEQATADHGLVFVIDDLHWYDAASLAVFRTLVPRTADLPILWIFTIRSGEYNGAVTRTLAEISRTAEVLEVGPLRDDAVEDIIADVLGSTPDDAITSVVRRAENIPLLVLELLHGLLEEDLVTVSDGAATLERGARVPDRFGSSIRERIAHLAPATQTLVHAAAVLGQGFSVSAAAELLNRAPAELVGPLAEAVGADILVDGPKPTFRHQAIREAAEAMIPLAALSRLRRDSARIRIAAGESILAVASSVAEYSFPGDDDSIALLDEAARQLVGVDAQGAAELASRAAELTEDEPRFGVMLSRLVPILWAGGRADEARRVAQELTGRLPPDAEGRMQLAIARLETESSFTRAIVTASRAADIDGLPGDIRAQLLAVTALNLANIGDLGDLEPALARAKAAAAEAGQFGALATVEATESVLRFYENCFDESHRLIKSAQELITRSTPVSASQWLPEGLWTAFLANSLGNSETALELAEGHLAETTRRRDAPAMAFWMMLRARILLDLGRLDDAKTQAEAVMDMAEELQLGDFAHATAGLVLFRVALYQADRAALQEVDGIVRAMSGSEALHRVGNWLAAIAADDDGDAPRALALTNDAYASLTMPVPSMTTPADFGDEIDLIRISIRGGATDRLPTILQVVTARADADPTNDLIAGVLHHARGLIDDSIEELQESVRRLRSTTRPIVLACALEDLGLALRTKDPEAASAAWEESFDTFDSCGAIRDAGRVRQYLRSVGVIRRPRTTTTESGLTTRELQIVERLAQGGTTKQIAADLYLSPHTIITHIRHASSKWNVSSRRALIDHFNAMN
jgi:DNA-binding NarL/FixJ family response regulator